MMSKTTKVVVSLIVAVAISATTMGCSVSDSGLVRINCDQYRITSGGLNGLACRIFNIF